MASPSGVIGSAWCLALTGAFAFSKATLTEGWILDFFVAIGTGVEIAGGVWRRLTISLGETLLATETVAFKGSILCGSGGNSASIALGILDFSREDTLRLLTLIS